MSDPTKGEKAAYARGYAAGRHRRTADFADAERRADAGGRLFEMLVAGLQFQGLTLDEILDAQIAGAKVLLKLPGAEPDCGNRPALS